MPILHTISRVRDYGADAGSIPMAGDWDGNGVFELGFITPDELWHFDLDDDRIDDPGEAEDTQFGQKPKCP